MVGRNVHVEGLVGTFQIVDGAPCIEGALQPGEIGKPRCREHLGLERAMEALVLAAALRVERPRINDIDAEPEQPDP